MNLYIQQRIFTWGDKFSIYDAAGNEKYYVEGEILTFGKKLHLYDLRGNELAYIEQQLLTFLPKYLIYRGDEEFAEVVKEFTFFFPKYSIEGLGWDINGQFMAHDYEITQNGCPIVTIRKEWMTWGDSYLLDIQNPADEIVALAVVLTIDCVTDSNSGASITISSN